MKNLINRLFAIENSQDTINWTLLFFRIGIGLSLINTHGLKKVLHYQDTVAHIPDPFGIGGEISTIVAILANVVFAGFLALGLFTRLSTLFIFGVTISGLLFVHINDPWPVKDVPLMYSMSLALIFVLGPGRYSLDNYLFKK